MFTDVDEVLVGYTVSFVTKIKCSKRPEWFLKWCVWVNLVYQGRVVHNGEQIRTTDLSASDWPCPFCVHCWGILNNSAEMRSHDCGARVAFALQLWAHPPVLWLWLWTRVRNPRCVRIKQIILELHRCAHLFSAAVYSTLIWAINIKDAPFQISLTVPS